MHERGSFRDPKKSSEESSPLNRVHQGQRSSIHPAPSSTLDDRYKAKGWKIQYFIRAQPKTEELSRFWELLNNGTIANQSPDGQEIIASMKRAVLSDDKVEWLETCFCNPPLSHERATIYDRFFQNMEISSSGTKAQLKGELFWDYLQANSQRQSLNIGALANPTQIRYVPIRIL